MSTAIFDHAEANLDAQPVCLCPWLENPYRLVNLWDIVNKFDCTELQELIMEMHFLRLLYVGNGTSDDGLTLLEAGIAAQGPGVSLFLKNALRSAQEDGDPYKPVWDLLSKLSNFCKSASFLDALDKMRLTGQRLLAGPSFPELRTEIRHLNDALHFELRKRAFLRVEENRTAYLDQPELFGPEVKGAFPSAARDIQEAGNCLAVECGTAAVFHLMRAAEIALRALAADRGVTYPDSSLNARQVGDLLGALDGKMADMRKADAKNWPSKDVKDAQINYYHGAIVEFRDFNEAWRKFMAHAHEGAFYDPLVALSIFGHVEKCMKALAVKISETTITPLYWTTK